MLREPLRLKLQTLNARSHDVSACILAGVCSGASLQAPFAFIEQRGLWAGEVSGPSRSPPHQGPSTNLVDPASSDMLVSKIKPCMSQYKLLYGETANGSLKQL